ncbi:hypothetical protein V9T40_010892 [Parthenolecanium corni]|uniref:C2H2-type domain-containing protein n=1 Tax=Parthenolecanium corni TaxID=536013 RepID=A0AAN9XXL9_9HEMI
MIAGYKGPYFCPNLCGRKYKYKYNLNVHLRNECGVLAYTNRSSTLGYLRSLIAPNVDAPISTSTI